MSKIKINDLNEVKGVTLEEAAGVMGGPIYMKLGDIKGDVSESSHVGGVNFAMCDGSVRVL